MAALLVVAVSLNVSFAQPHAPSTLPRDLSVVLMIIVEEISLLGNQLQRVIFN